MQQFRASAYYAVVRWHKLGEMDIEYTSHISIVLAICLPKIIKFCGDLTKFWQKTSWVIFGTPCRLGRMAVLYDSRSIYHQCACNYVLILSAMFWLLFASFSVYFRKYSTRTFTIFTLQGNSVNRWLIHLVISRNILTKLHLNYYGQL